MTSALPPDRPGSPPEGTRAASSPTQTGAGSERSGDAALDVSRIRRDFPILARTVYGKPLVYLDNAATTQKPTPVLERTAAFYRDSNANVHRGVHYLSEMANGAYEAARETVRGFLNAERPGEIIFTRGTTESINIVAQAFHDRVGEGDEILVTEMEHHSNLVPWQKLCERRGAVLKVLPFTDDGVLQEALLDSLLSERTTLFALTYVSNVLGTVHPVAALIERAHARGVPVLLDAAQAVPHFPVDVRALDCDFLAFSGHKMYAETGIGILYGKETWLDELPPHHYGGGMVASVDFSGTSVAGLPHKFESGTPNISGAVSLKAAVDYLQDVGWEKIQRHERELLRHAGARLAALEGIDIYGAPPRRCGVLSFNLSGASAYDVAMILDKLGVAVRSGTHCAEPVMKHYGMSGCVRASFALYNTRDDVDAMIRGLERAKDLLVRTTDRSDRDDH